MGRINDIPVSRFPLSGQYVESTEWVSDPSHKGQACLDTSIILKYWVLVTSERQKSILAAVDIIQTDSIALIN